MAARIEVLRTRFSIRLAWKIAVVFIALVMELLPAAELRPETVKVWNDYIRAADGHMKARAATAGHFLWSDEARDRTRRLRQGEILAEPSTGNGSHNVPYGLIHDWIGAMFVPHATIDEVIAVVQSYDHYKEFYKPAVAEGRLLDRTRDSEKFSLVMIRKTLMVNAAVDTENETTYRRLDDDRLYSVTQSTRVREVRDYGQPGQYELAPGLGSGYVWRLYTIARYQARDGGVYVELEAIALSRDIPFSLGWLVKPLVDRLSRDSVSSTLLQTRDAVVASRAVWMRAGDGQ